MLLAQRSDLGARRSRRRAAAQLAPPFGRRSGLVRIRVPTSAPAVPLGGARRRGQPLELAAQLGMGRFQRGLCRAPGLEFGLGVGEGARILAASAERCSSSACSAVTVSLSSRSASGPSRGRSGAGASAGAARRRGRRRCRRPAAGTAPTPRGGSAAGRRRSWVRSRRPVRNGGRCDRGRPHRGLPPPRRGHRDHRVAQPQGSLPPVARLGPSRHREGRAPGVRAVAVRRRGWRQSDGGVPAPARPAAPRRRPRPDRASGR